MFRFLQDDPAREWVTVTINGDEVSVPEQISVAAAVLYYNSGYTRTTPVNASPRAPLCMMGVCYECLMVIDGQANRRACQELVAEGMNIERQIGAGTE